MTNRFRARNSFWLAYTNRNRSSLTLMTPEFRRFVGRRCSNGCLTLHVRRDEFTELVARWKQDLPSLKILRYARIQRLSRGPLVGGSFFDVAWEHRYQWCLLLRTTGEPRHNRGLLWMDITNGEFRAAIVQHLADEVRNSGCDGLAIEGHHWDLSGPNAIRNGAELNANWQAGARAVLEELKAELGPGYIILFNGLWGFRGNTQAVRQGEMLDSADGIAVEFFGVDGHGKPGTDVRATEWEYFVGNLNRQLGTVGRHKYANINGQRLSGVYADYVDDYTAGLYCYANFLLGPLGQKHGFHYGNFQCTKLAKERSGGYDFFDFQELTLGQPLEPFGDTLSPLAGKSREFEGGIVLVAPTAGGTQSFRLLRNYYTMGGELVGPGTRKIGAGKAEILLTASPTAPPATLEVYSTIGRNIGPKTEWMVQPVKSGWHRYKVLNLRVRSTDIGSAILVRVEVDDDPRTHGIVVIRPVSGTFAKTSNDYPYAEPPNGGATNEYASVTYTTDNMWKDLPVKLDPAMGRTCYRVVSIRVDGGVQVSQISLSGLTSV